MVVDRITNVTIEVRGSELDKELGNQVEVTGSPLTGVTPVEGATQVIQASAVKHLGKGGCASVAKKVGAAAGAGAAAGGVAAAAGGAAAAGAAAGIAGTTIAVVGGVAAAATVGGLAAVGALPGQGESGVSSSR